MTETELLSARKNAYKGYKLRSVTAFIYVQAAEWCLQLFTHNIKINFKLAIMHKKTMTPPLPA